MYMTRSYSEPSLALSFTFCCLYIVSILMTGGWSRDFLFWEILSTLEGVIENLSFAFVFPLLNQKEITILLSNNFQTQTSMKGPVSMKALVSVNHCCFYFSFDMLFTQKSFFFKCLSLSVLKTAHWVQEAISCKIKPSFAFSNFEITEVSSNSFEGVNSSDLSRPEPSKLCYLCPVLEVFSSLPRLLLYSKA